MSFNSQKTNTALKFGDVLLNNMVNEVQRLKAKRDELLYALECIAEESTDLGAREYAKQAIAKAKGE